MASIKLMKVGKSFRNTVVLKDISFESRDGELMVILGPSGCGKSTILRLIAGLESLDCGEIFIGENRIDRLPPQKRQTALVFQNYALYPHMTVAQNLAFPLKIAGEDKNEIKKKVEATAETLGLLDRLESRPAELSGGQRQRVALGRAIIRRPKLFLLDEPLSNLDADLRQSLRRELVDLIKRLGTTALYVTHDQVEAMTMADRMVVIESGRIRQIGAPEQIYNEPLDAFVAAFIGTPKINLIEARIEEGKIEPLGITIESLNRRFDINKFMLGVRPEDIRVKSDGEFAGKIEGVEFLGDRTIATIGSERYRLTALMETGVKKPGENVRFSVDFSRLHFFDLSSGRRI
jgi:multiple sugar transport system ATP-binding protein